MLPIRQQREGTCHTHHSLWPASADRPGRQPPCAPAHGPARARAHAHALCLLAAAPLPVLARVQPPRPATEHHLNTLGATFPIQACAIMPKAVLGKYSAENCVAREAPASSGSEQPFQGSAPWLQSCAPACCAWTWKGPGAAFRLSKCRRSRMLLHGPVAEGLYVGEMHSCIA